MQQQITNAICFLEYEFRQCFSYYSGIVWVDPEVIYVSFTVFFLAFISFAPVTSSTAL